MAESAARRSAESREPRAESATGPEPEARGPQPSSPRRPRFRIATAYAVTVRVLWSYLWLRLWRPLLGPALYETKLVERHRRNARRVERTILELDGLFIKVGQLISILTNFLPGEFRHELEGLQDQVPARPLAQTVARIRDELGKPPDELFAEFDPVPIASASLAQVYRAVLHDGRRVAVKVQHADIDEIAALDLTAIRRILALVQMFTRIRGLGSYHAEISQMIREELDFTLEAAHIRAIASHFEGDAMVRFPAVVPEYSTRRVLTTELMPGTKVSDVAALDAQGIDRTALAQRILGAYCRMIFVDGVYHADPHPGNILVQGDGGVVFVDFGAVGVLSPPMKEGIPLFLEGVIQRDAPKITAAMRTMGFVSRTAELEGARGAEDVAERVIEWFQRRFLDQITIDSWRLADVQVDVKAKLEAMADLRKLDVSFRELTATFQVPKDWVLLERTLLLLLGLCTHLDPALNPMRTIRPYMEDLVLGKGRDWTGLMRTAVKQMALSALTIPEGVQKLLARTNRGELELRIRDVHEAAQLIYAAVHQLIFGILATGAGAMAYLALERHERTLAVAGGVVSALFLLALLASHVAARRWRR